MKQSEENMDKEQWEDAIIFASFEQIQIFERIINKLEITRQELQKVAERMKPMENKY